MDRSLDLTVRRCAARLALEIGGASQLGYVPGRIFYDLVTLDDVSVFQSHFAARLEPKKLRRGRLPEIGGGDKKPAGEWGFSRSGIQVFRVVYGGEFSH